MKTCLLRRYKEVRQNVIHIRAYLLKSVPLTNRGVNVAKGIEKIWDNFTNDNIDVIDESTCSISMPILLRGLAMYICHCEKTTAPGLLSVFTAQTSICAVGTEKEGGNLIRLLITLHRLCYWLLTSYTKQELEWGIWTNRVWHGCCSSYFSLLSVCHSTDSQVTLTLRSFNICAFNIHWIHPS